ncbi:MAG: hypothetical protein PHH83_02700 [Patescibacteria group bacterium]|nr:hypothetical protein [Patescibacteria group bacterium]
MAIIFYIVILIILFGVLGLSADFLVHNIKIISRKLGIKIFALGIVLGVMTSLPEMAVSVNSIINEVPNISVGNLMGSVMVIFGLILGISLILNRKIRTDGDMKYLLPQLGVVFLPFILGLDKKFGMLDGIIMISVYIILLIYLYQISKKYQIIQVSIIKEQKIFKSILLSIISAIVVVASSYVIVKLSVILLNKLGIKPFILGLLIFSLGTNLPEITVSITSWKKKSPELSISHLMGSIITNVIILGAMSIINPITINLGYSYTILIIFAALILFLTAIFYKTKKSLDRIEGLFLISIYFIFIYTIITMQI